MNKNLYKEIARHIYENLLIISSDFIDPKLSNSLLDSNFILDKKLQFNIDDKTITKNIWGCQLLTGNHELKILCGDCSLDDSKEYAILIKLKGFPAYGVYSCFNKNRLVDQETLIAVSVDNSGWLECNTYLQATFLAAMEQVKELGLAWSKCQDFKNEFELLKSFINHHDSIYSGDNNAG